MWNVLLPTAFESVRMRGLVAFYSLWSIKAQTQLEIGECETSSGVLLLCLVHTPVLVTADQIQNRNVLVFVFFSSDHLGLLFFLWVLSAAKKTIWVSYSNLPAILGVAFGICPALVSAFYFLSPLLLPLERMLGLIKWPVDWMSDQVIWTCQSWVSVKAVKDRCSKPDCDGLLLSQKSLLCFVPQNSYLKSLDII